MKVILTDIDDTILQFAYAFEKWAVEEKGYVLKQSIRDGGTIEDALGCSRDDVDSLVIEFSTNPTFFGVIPAESDALAVIPRLHKMGYQFAAISSCVDGPEVTEVRRKNLEAAFGFEWTDVHCVGLLAPKNEALQKYQNAWWVEDNAKNAILGASMGHKTFLLKRAYNDISNRTVRTGRVKWFEESKGFGFIRDDEGGGDIFVHVDALKRSGMKTLVDGERVEYELRGLESGKMAAENVNRVSYLRRVNSWHDVFDAIVQDDCDA